MQTASSQGQGANSFETFFSDTKSGKYVPRAVYVDLEESVIDQIKNGVYKNLFNPSKFQILNIACIF